jgi:TRAP-type C4-dicarboxylate transport system substrate-binding protein
VTWASSPYFLATSNKQVKTLDDIKGLKIRAADGTPVEVLKALGAIPVTMGMPDTYLYLKKGAIDGVTNNWEALYSFKQYELLKYCTYIPLFTVYFTVAINHDTWNNLPQDIKEQINSVSGLQGSIFWGENMFDTAVPALREELDKLNVDIVEYTLPEEELARWSEIAKPLWNDWVAKMTAAGHPEAQEILNTTLELIKTFNPDEHQFLIK